MIERAKHFDTKNAESLLAAAERQMSYTESVAVTSDSAFSIIRNVYECFRMIGDALLVAKGVESADHVAPINELLKLKADTARSTALVDNLRKLRHKINYYGYLPNKTEAEDALSLARACFKPLLGAARKELAGQDVRRFRPVT